MANYSTFLKRLGIKGEDTRGTVEASPGVWHAVLPSTKFDYSLNLLMDETLRGVMANYPPAPGLKMGVAKIMMPVRALNIGEYFQMLIGTPSSAQQASTAAYLHTFTPGSTLLLPTYTFFYDRSMNVLKYNMGSVYKIKVSSAPDGFVMAEIDAYFKTEASGSIGSPSYTESEELTFQHVDFKLAGSSNTEVKSWSVELSNGMLVKRTMSGSQDAIDFIATKNEAQGEFVIYFANATERDKFVAGSTSSVEIVITGDTIESPYKYTLEILMDDVRYMAFPYDDEDGLLAAKVTWKSFYSNSRPYRVRVTNTYTTYTIV